MSPNNKSGQVLHPSVCILAIILESNFIRFGCQQKRILTVRECARAQGFPDDYEFVSVNKERKEMVKAIDDVSACCGSRFSITDLFHLSNSDRSVMQYLYR